MEEDSAKETEKWAPKRPGSGYHERMVSQKQRKKNFRKERECKRALRSQFSFTEE